MSETKQNRLARIEAVSDDACTTTTIARIGATVDAQLDAVLWRLIGGEIELHDLTPALQAWWVAAYEAGRKSLDESAEAQSLRFQRDLWYWVACNRGKKPGDYYGHLSSRLWAQADVSGDYSAWREAVAA